VLGTGLEETLFAAHLAKVVKDKVLFSYVNK
jgi:hypothetical protein